jgi:hypothetical protein
MQIGLRTRLWIGNEGGFRLDLLRQRIRRRSCDDETAFQTKVIDLIGIRDRRYIDYTATHKNRVLGDIMRYV